MEPGGLPDTTGTMELPQVLSKEFRNELVLDPELFRSLVESDKRVEEEVLPLSLSGSESGLVISVNFGASGFSDRTGYVFSSMLRHFRNEEISVVWSQVVDRGEYFSVWGEM